MVGPGQLLARPITRQVLLRTSDAARQRRTKCVHLEKRMRLSFVIRMHTTWAALLSILASLSTRYAYAEEDKKPRPMNPEQPVDCFRGDDDEWTRVQCNEQSKRCLFAPNGVLDEKGKPTKKLNRARHCNRKDGPLDFDALKKAGYSVQRGLVDAPYGWMRDERGRVFQVNFDLRRRVYVGGGYGLTSSVGADGNRTVIGQPTLDIGMLVMQQRVGRTRHRLHLVQGQLALEPFNADLVLLHYDFSRLYDNPAIRITSFFGDPRRHDLSLDLGMWIEGGHLEYRSTDAEQEQLWRLFTVNGTLDLWQSPDMYSYIRLRGGLGLERASSNMATTREALTPGAALEGDITFDRMGFHQLGFEFAYQHPIYTTEDPRVGDQAQRIKASVEYEMIILAINDQPLSLHLQVAAEKRTDSPLIDSRWAAKANAGLRFSLWAPARSR